MRSCDGIGPHLRFCLLRNPRRRRAVNRGRPRRRCGEKCEAGTVEEAGMYPLTDTFTFQAPTNITFGPGAIGQLGQIVAPLGKRPLVVSDPGTAAAGILQQVLDALGPAVAHVETFTEVEPNPSIETVDRAAAISRPGDGHLRLPTAAGTGSEVTQFTVITDRGRPFKLTLGSPYVVPTAAVCDPNLTLSMPQPLTAATGMDALTHGIECYINTVTNPLAKTYALEAIRLIGRYLRTAYATGKHLEARYHMLLASTMAAMAFSRTRLGKVHAMSHPPGARFEVPHGVANAVLLPHVMEWNLIAGMETYPRIGEALGEPVTGLPPRAAAGAAVEAVRQLAAAVGLPE